jgi:dCMP deaminase
MYVAHVMAQRSKCVLAQVGCVIATPDNRVNSLSYNGPPKGYPAIGPCTGWCPRAMKSPEERAAGYEDAVEVHAEANAIARADFTQIQGGTIYSTSACCLGCAKLIAGAGLLRLVHVVASEADLRRNPEAVENFLRDAGLDVVRVSG